jgi:CubicO group peptidase (beta-lactamase class C family)
MRAAVFEPLGMEHTDFLRTERVSGRLAVGYALKRGRMTPVKDREIAIAPAGSVFSSTADMARYVGALAGGGEPILRRETLALMLTPQDGSRPGDPAMGLAFMLERHGGHRTAGHDGGWPGFVSSMLLAPDDGVGVLAFTNTSVSFAPHDVAEGTLRRLLGIPEPAEATGVPESPHLWPRLTGVYKPARGLNTNLRLWPVTGGEVHVVVKRGHLTVTAPSPVPQLRKGIRLHAADADDPWVFQARIDDVVVPVVFEPGPDGRAEAVRTGSARGGFVRLHRRPRATSLRLWGRAAGAAAAAAGVAATVRWRRRR